MKKNFCKSTVMRISKRDQLLKISITGEGGTLQILGQYHRQERILHEGDKGYNWQRKSGIHEETDSYGK